MPPPCMQFIQQLNVIFMPIKSKDLFTSYSDQRKYNRFIQRALLVSNKINIFLILQKATNRQYHEDDL